MTSGGFLAVCVCVALLVAGCFQAATPDDAGNQPDVPVVVLPRYVATGTSTGYDSFEPTIGVLDDGTVFVTTWNFQQVGVGVERAEPGVARSVDGGLTWQEVTPRVAGQRFPGSSNDPYLHVDPTWGRVFMLDLQAQVCHTLSWSDDAGETWTSNPVACGQPVGSQDHPTLFTSTGRVLPHPAAPRLVHYCTNQGDLHTVCATSLDGGLSWTPLRPGPFSDAPTGPTPGSHVFCTGRTGHGVSDAEGRLYIAHGHCGIPRVAVSADDGQSWTSYAISENVTMPVVTPNAPVPGAAQPSAHEVTLAVDDAGTLYAVWIDGTEMPWLAASADQGQSWSAPIPVASPSTTITSFPTIAAGAAGRVAVAYYASNSTTPRDEMTERDTWNGFLTIVENASTAPTLYHTQVNPSDDPLVRGVCAGTRCGDKFGRSEVGDFIDVVIDATGRPWAAFVDVCLDACATSPTYAPGGLGIVASLTSGPSLRDVDVPLVNGSYAVNAASRP